MLHTLTREAPAVNPLEIMRAGATGLRGFLSPEMYAVAIAAYMDALHAVFGLCIALSVVAVLVSLFVPWTRLQVEGLVLF